MRNFFACAALAAASVAAVPQSFYVDCEDGSDSQGQGTSYLPWQTLGRAQAAVRALQGASATVFVSGDCPPPADLSPHLALTSADSGAPGETITWTSDPAPGKKPARLLGGAPLPASGWAPAGAPFPAGVLVSALPAAAGGAGGASSWSLAAGGLGTCGHTVAELFYGREPMLVARYPNADPSTGMWEWMNIEAVQGSGGLSFNTSDPRPAQWGAAAAAAGSSGAAGVWAHGYWQFDWADSYVQIVGAQAGEGGKGSLLSISASTPPLYGFLPKARWMGVNILAELDVAGEYFIDAANGRVYAFPPGPLVDGDPSSTLWISLAPVAILGPGPSSSSSSDRAGSEKRAAPAAARARGQFMSGSLDQHVASGVTSTLPDASTALSNVVFQGLSVLYTRDTGVSLPNVYNVTVSGVDSSCHTRHGLELSGANSTASGVTVRGTGCGAVGVYGGNMNTLEPGNMVVADSSFSAYARIQRTYNPGLGWFGCVGCTFSNLSISDAPHNGALGAGNNNLFVGCSFTDLCYEATDSGGWYTGRSWVRRGNVIANSTFTRIKNTETMTLGWPSVQAVYLDDQMSGTSIVGSTFVDCDTGIVVGGGRDVVVQNNSFYNCTLPVHLDNRGMNWQLDTCTQNATWTGPLVQDLIAVNYTFPPYATAYPPIVSTMKNHPCVPVNVTVSGNTYCNSTSFIDVANNVSSTWFDVVSGNTEFVC